MRNVSHRAGPHAIGLCITNKASVGDGVYLFSQMESVYWIARRYDIPFLMIVLNNGGWNAPKVSALLVHKDGLSSKSNRRGGSIEKLLLFNTRSLIRRRP